MSAQVVRAGLKWSPEASAKFATKGKFIFVGGERTTPRMLSGAIRSWPKEPEIIYSTGYRIAGRPADIESALRAANVPEQTIRDVINSAITSTNYETTKAVEFAQEIKSATEKRSVKDSAVKSYNIDQVLWFGKNLDVAQVATKAGQAPAKVATSVVKASKTPKSFAERLAEAQKSGKVLDVSGLDVQTGAGAKLSVRPKGTKSGKYGTERVALISNDLDKYVAALRLAFGDKGPSTYSSDVDEIRVALSSKNVPGSLPDQGSVHTPAPMTVSVAQPVKKPTKPTVRSPVATLGAVPTLGQVPTLRH